MSDQTQDLTLDEMRLTRRLCNLQQDGPGRRIDLQSIFAVGADEGDHGHAMRCSLLTAPLVRSPPR